MTKTERVFRVKTMYDFELPEDKLRELLDRDGTRHLLDIEDDKDLEWELIANLDARKALQCISVVLWDSGQIQAQVRRVETPDAESEDEVSDDYEYEDGTKVSDLSMGT